MGLQIEHYINSSGLQEMVEGSPIAHEFKHIYASRFMYDKDGRAMWPAVAIDFTAKMQILYMNNKGVENISDNKEINNIMAAEDRRIPFDHMIYFGDGLTDIPSMKLLRSQGGFTIAIYTPEHELQTIELVKRNIINFACQADYVLREDTVQNWMLSTLSVGNVISEGLSLQDRILLETASSGGEYLSKVIEAMKKSVRVKVSYQRTIIPLC